MFPISGSAGKLGGRQASVRPLDARHSPYIDGNRSPRLPAGHPGKLDIIAVGPYDGTSVPVVVRNNTSRTVTRITVKGAAVTAGGALLGTGSDQGIEPTVVRPGEIAIGYVYFDGGVPLSSKFRLTATWDPSSAQYENKRDLVISKTSGLIDRLVGYAHNATGRPVSGPIGLLAACFSSSGKLLSTESDFADQDSLATGETAPFQISLSHTCPTYLITAGGYSN